MLLLNALNVVTVRMQNVDYKHNRSLRKAVGDLLVNDRFRALYKGIVPQFLAFSSLSAGRELMQQTHRSKDSLVKYYSWPFIFLCSTLVAHPMMVISLQVLCARNHVNWNGSKYVKSGKPHMTWLAIQSNIKRNYGLKGFYRGYLPSLIIYAAV